MHAEHALGGCIRLQLLCSAACQQQADASMTNGQDLPEDCYQNSPLHSVARLPGSMPEWLDHPWKYATQKNCLFTRKQHVGRLLAGVKVPFTMTLTYQSKADPRRQDHHAT